jgi:mono/diheme cytochrome c family protein
MLDTPFGKIRTPNITPDAESGVGSWQLADFVRALRWGIAPDDTHYMPAFPFPYYNRLSAGDLADIGAFLVALPVVPQLNGASAPNNFAGARSAVAVTATPFPGPYHADPTKDQVWNRGAYLVETVGRCGDCHTPRDIFGAPVRDRALAGAPAGFGRKAAPNITPGGGVGRWTEEEIVRLLATGETPEVDFVGGAMAEVVKNTARLDDADRRAIAVYLKSLPPARSPKKNP